MERRRELDEEEERRPTAAPAAPVPEPPADVLRLQRTAGNAAVARMLMREPAEAAPAGPASLGPRKPFNPFAVDLGSAGLMDDYIAAMDAVRDWFDAAVKSVGGGSFMQSVPELVYMARGLPVKTRDGKTSTVGEVVLQAADVERTLRTQAKARGVRLLDHRALDDRKGVQSEALATLKNLGAKIPDKVSFGGDDAKITIGIGGTVTADLKPGAGKTEVEGEISKDGGKASVKYPGGKAGVEVSDKGIKLDLKAGDLVSIKGSVKKSDENTWEWKADLQIGTLGKLITPEEIAKVMQGAQKTLGDSAADLAAGVSADNIKTHGAAVKEAVSEALEKAKKSAEQNKAGWQVGVGVQGGGKDGGFSATVTLTWVF